MLEPVGSVAHGTYKCRNKQNQAEPWIPQTTPLVIYCQPKKFQEYIYGLRKFYTMKNP